MARMSATDAAVQVMLDEGIEFVFGIPGAAILPLYQSILKSGRIRHYTVRHEEGGTHAADGYSRATGKVGVMLGTSGPAGRRGRLAGKFRHVLASNWDVQISRWSGLSAITPSNSLWRRLRWPCSTVFPLCWS